MKGFYVGGKTFNNLYTAYQYNDMFHFDTFEAGEPVGGKRLLI